MVELISAHTSMVGAANLSAAHGLLREVFGEEFTEDDWEHTLGGLHALAWERGKLIGHAAVIQRRMLNRGRALRTGYVESVGVSQEHRRRGHGATLMDWVEGVLEAYDVGALSASAEAEGFYAARGWRPWEGPLSALAPDGIEEVASDRRIYVFPGAVSPDPFGHLTCDWRDGDLW